MDARLVNRMFLYLYLFSVSVFVSIFAANREVGYASDSYVYANVFNISVDGGYDGRFGFAFKALMTGVSAFSTDYRVFFFFCSIILIISGLTALTKVVHRDSGISYQVLAIAILAFMLLSPFFYSMQTNILRHGLAVPFLLLTYHYFDEKRYSLCVAFSIIAIGMHWSSIYFIMLLPLLNYNVKRLSLVFIVLSISYLSGLSELMLKPVSDFIGSGDMADRISSYGADSSYKSGVRWDFWLFSSGMLSLSMFIERKMQLRGRITKYILISMIPFLIIGYIPFSDRLLVFQWLMLPALTSLPLLHIYERVNNFVGFLFLGFILLLAIFLNVLNLLS